MVKWGGFLVGLVGLVGDGWVVSGSVDIGSHKLLENVWFLWSKAS